MRETRSFSKSGTERLLEDVLLDVGTELELLSLADTTKAWVAILCSRPSMETSSLEDTILLNSTSSHSPAASAGTQRTGMSLDLALSLMGVSSAPLSMLTLLARS